MRTDGTLVVGTRLGVSEGRNARQGHCGGLLELHLAVGCCVVL